MAQVVKYFENDVSYEEGPFVVTSICGSSDCRIEVEFKGHHCPALPDVSIGRLVASSGLLTKTPFLCASDVVLRDSADKMVKICDWLNQQVREENIILDPEFRRTWVTRQTV